MRLNEWICGKKDFPSDEATVRFGFDLKLKNSATLLGKRPMKVPSNLSLPVQFHVQSPFYFSV
jgi:hypothetical protein